MGIGARLKKQAPASSAAVPQAKQKPTQTGVAQLNDPLLVLKQTAHSALFSRLGGRLYDPSLSAEELSRLVRSELEEVLESELTQLSPDERHELVNEITEDVLGLGPIESLLADPEITEIMVNGRDSIFVERRGKLYLTEVNFLSEDHLIEIIQRIVTSVGRRIDESSPMVDARLADGSRVNTVIPPLALDGPVLTIRKFSDDFFGAPELVELGALSEEAAAFLEACVVTKKNILISGGTGSGKTTLLNMMSSFIPNDERIVTIEDAAELQLQQRHTVRLESRPANVEGAGAVSIRDLLKNTLRMRPDRIIVGECRGAEALDMLQSMNTGHSGSLSTVHANTPRDALARLETMVLTAGVDLPLRAIHEQVTSALDLIVQTTRLPNGRRLVTHITEVEGMESDTPTMSDLYATNLEFGDPETVTMQPTGIRPTFAEVLEAEGFGSALNNEAPGALVDTLLAERHA